MLLGIRSSPYHRRDNPLMPGERDLTVFCRLEPIEYDQAWELQKKVWSQRVEGRVDDALIVLEHPPTLTVGMSGKLQNLLVTKEELAKRGIRLFFTDRGGDITYHGPGQLVAYPIIDLTGWQKDVHRYVHNLEEVVVRTLADFSILAGRHDEYVGVWVDNEKIAAIGVRVRKWVTMHGLALNVNPILEHFSLIHPCGIVDKGVTSIARILCRDVPMEVVATRMVDHFAEVFGLTVEWGSFDSLEEDI